MIVLNAQSLGKCRHNINPLLFCLCEYSGKNFHFFVRNKKIVVLNVCPAQYPIPDSALQQSPREDYDNMGTIMSSFLSISLVTWLGDLLTQSCTSSSLIAFVRFFLPCTCFIPS